MTRNHPALQPNDQKTTILQAAKVVSHMLINNMDHRKVKTTT